MTASSACPQDRPLVNFFVVGAQKSGTRPLASFLRQHPEIGMSRASRPEPHFFDTQNAKAANPDYTRYYAMFDPDALARVTGDATPSYMFVPWAVPAIYRYNPDAKLIALLRAPAERAYSQWNMQVETGRETRDFAAALRNEAEYCRSGELHRNFSYVRRGFYFQQLSQIFSVFPRRQCLILRTEDLRDRHSDTMDRVFRFLNVASITAPTRKIVHSRQYPPMPKPAERALKRLFRKDTVALEHLLGWECSSWK